MAARPGRGLNQRDGDFRHLPCRNHGADTELGLRRDGLPLRRIRRGPTPPCGPAHG